MDTTYRVTLQNETGQIIFEFDTQMQATYFCKVVKGFGIAYTLEVINNA